MSYGTFKAADSLENSSNSAKMTCFKFLFYNCCFRFGNRRSSLRGSAARKSSANSSNCEGLDDGSSAQLSSQVPKSGSTSSPSRPPESYRSLDEDEALVSSTPRSETVPSKGKDEEKEEISVPLIHVLNCSEDISEKSTEDVFYELSVDKQDNNVEKVSVCSSRSQKSLHPLEGETDDGVVMTENSKKSSILTQDGDVEHLPAYKSRSQLSISTERVQDVSMADVNSGSAEDEQFESVKVSGDILFGLNYNYKAGTLEVHVKECRNLSPVDAKKNRSDPYVKGYLLPDRSKTGKRKTKVKKHSLNPVFDEVLKFPVSVSELETRTLWLSVWHSQFGRNDFLGEMMLPLGLGKIENYGCKRHALKERLGKDDSFLRYNGDIVLSLKFVPSDSGAPKNQEMPDDNTEGELHVVVKEAKNLIAAYSNGTSNPFCKSYLLPAKNKASKQKTVVVKKNCNPHWNHTFIYSDVTLSGLKERCLELTIWSHDKISSNSFLGGVRLSLGEGTSQGCDVEWMDSAGEEVNLWDAMLRKPGLSVEGSLLLRTQMQRT